MTKETCRCVMPVVTLLLAMGCGHALPPPDTGGSSFAFVQAPFVPVPKATAEAREEKNVEQYQEAIPIRPLATPVYPPRALAAKVGLVTIGVKITVDHTGRVIDIGPSLLAVTIPGRFEADFQEAVRAAVTLWRFRPAEIWMIEDVPMPGGGSYQRMTTLRRVETSFDLSFTFTAPGAVLGGKD
jgi:hypothetical protein